MIEQILSPSCWLVFLADWQLFLQAFGVTVMVSIAALALALALGVVFGVMSTSQFLLPRNVARAYVEAIQNTPLVLQAYVFYLALPYIGVMMGQVSVGIFAVGIYHGAYIAEVVRAGIQSIPRGQSEAAASQGFTYVQTMRWVILPQTVKIILPPLVNQMVNLIKNTSVIALIGGTDLMNRTNDWATSGASIYGPPFLVCGVLYFLLCFPLSTWGRRYEERLKKKDSHASEELRKIEEELS
ncbi:amino acid ABC transporter permease [Mailhella massiliensis]|uniref:amino acid ABC transporter permease n=1 Tax=Mailhella massiliensis TaxID=1903261 RepID=UPI0023522ED2|nr:amino acid ABC transporter permease [Mailhella massiliensis]